MPSIRSIKKRKRAGAADPVGDWERSLAEDPSFKDIHVVRSPHGEARMSKVLEALVEPYEDIADTFDARDKLIALGILAWNIALLPTEEHSKRINEALGVLGDLSRSDKHAAKDIITALIARKLSLFADNKRYIVSYKLADQGNNWHLSVISTLDRQP